MIDGTTAFSGFSVSDLTAAKEFYGQTLGLAVEERPEGLVVHLGTDKDLFIYPKPDHVPASFTILNFPVEDIDQAVDDLAVKGVEFEHYEQMHTDEKGIARGKSAGMGPDIAWFKDPAGNTLSVLCSD